jgi:hypothetical protein
VSDLVDRRQPAELGLLFRSAAALSVWVPLVVTLFRTSAVTAWRDDLGVIRSLSLAPIGGEGLVSAILGRALGLLPLGGVWLRVGLVGAVAAAAAGGLAFFLVVRLLGVSRRRSAMTPLLALGAALLAVLGAAWQEEATLAGGGALGAVLCLLCLQAGSSRGLSPVAWGASGVALSLALVESRSAGLAGLVAWGAARLAIARLPSPASLAVFAAAAVAAAFLVVLPFAVRTGSEVLSAPFAVQASSAGAWHGLEGSAGPVAFDWPLLVAAAAGLALAALSRSSRPLSLGLCCWVLGSLAVSEGPAGALLPWPGRTWLLLGAVASVAGFAFSIDRVAAWLLRARLPFARPALALTASLGFAAVIVTWETSGRDADRSRRDAAELWTDEALQSLPPSSVVIARSPSIAFRLWGAALARGARPDLVVVPTALLDSASLASDLLALEPALGPLVRQMAVHGKPTEYALSSLADARPLFVEFDPSWDPRLFDHLIPEAFWLRFAPHALGRSDRVEALKGVRTAFRRVARRALDPAHADAATLQVLYRRGREQALALAALGDRSNAHLVLGDLRKFDGARPFVDALATRLDARSRGRVDISDLLD